MKFVIFVMAMLVCILLIMAYAQRIMAHDADERAERMYIKWKENVNERNNSEDGQGPCES